MGGRFLLVGVTTNWALQTQTHIYIEATTRACLSALSTLVTLGDGMESLSISMLKRRSARLEKVLWSLKNTPFGLTPHKIKDPSLSITPDFSNLG